MPKIQFDVIIANGIAIGMAPCRCLDGYVKEP